MVSRPEIELATGEGTILVIEDEEDIMMIIRKLPDISGTKLYPLIMEARSNLKVIVCSAP